MSSLMDLDSDGEVQEEALEEGEVVEDGEIDEEQPLGIDKQNQEEVLQSPQELAAAKAEVDSASAETEDEDGEVSEKEQAPDEREAEQDEGDGKIKDEQTVDKDLVHDTESEEDAEPAVENADVVEPKEASSDTSPAISDEEDGDSESLPHRRRRRRRRSTGSSPHRRRRHHREREPRKARAKLMAREQKRRKTSVPSRQTLHENVNRSMREVYVGGLAWSSARQDVVRDALEAAFQELEDYRLRYRDVKNPIVSVHFPPPAPPKRQRTHNTSTFVFVELYDRLLARTALQLSGLRIGGRSARICPPSAGVNLEGTTLDIGSLRQKELLPFSAGPGAQLRCHVWLGNISSAYGREERRKMMQTQIKEDAELEPDSFAKHVDASILALPGLRIRYPDITRAVLALRISECGRFGFLEAATERIASTIIAGGRLELANGMHLKTGWPVGGEHGEEHAAPPITPEGGDGERLHLCKGRRGPIESTNVVMDVDESDFVEKMECEVFLGGTQSLKAEAIWGTLADRLTELPSFKREYSTLDSPIINVRLAIGASFGFVRLADARLASTAVAMEEIVVHGRKVLICRPSSFKHDEGVEEPLDLKRAVLKPPPPPMQPPPAPKEESQAILDVSPPPPPMVPSAGPQSNCRLWIGNLPSRHTLSQLSDDEDDAQNGQPSSKETRLLRHLDRHVAGLAMSLPGYDLEEGPPLKRISVHHTGRFAFADVQGSQERVEQLLTALDGSLFHGRPLSANWSRVRRRAVDPGEYAHQHRRRRALAHQFPVDAVPPGVLSLMPAVAERMKSSAAWDAKEGPETAERPARGRNGADLNEL